MPAPNVLSEHDLASRIRAKDKQAFAILYDQYSGALYSIIKQIITNDDNTAQDVLQEVMICIWHNIHLFDDSKGRLFTWMLHICRNTAIDKLWYKDSKNVLKIFFSGEFITYIEAYEIPNSALGNTGIRKIVETLEEKYRDVIHYTFVQGHTRKEVAFILGIPLSIVEIRLKTGLKMLRDKL